jgi:hypothetical protein
MTFHSPIRARSDFRLMSRSLADDDGEFVTTAAGAQGTGLTVTDASNEGGKRDFDENDRKHLDLIQGVVNRLAANEFLIKGWCLTVAAALLGYAAAHDRWPVALLSIIVVAGFGGLDVWFLRQERLFRALWVDVISRPRPVPPVPLYSLNMAAYRDRVSLIRKRRDENGTWRTGILLSPPIAILYGSLLAVSVILLVSTAA